MECDDAGPSDSAFALTVYVRTYREITRVRVESDFIDAHTGAPSGCRSTGAYERSFFRQLETGLQ